MPVPNERAQLTSEQREELIGEVSRAFFDRQPEIRDALLRRGEHLAEIAVDLVVARLLSGSARQDASSGSTAVTESGSEGSVRRSTDIDHARERDALRRLLWELPAEFSEPPRPEVLSSFRVVKRRNVRAVHQG